MNLFTKLFSKPEIISTVLQHKEYVASSSYRTVVMMSVGKSLMPIPTTVEVPEKYKLNFILEKEKVTFLTNKDEYQKVQVGTNYQVTYKRTFFKNKIKILKIAKS